MELGLALWICQRRDEPQQTPTADTNRKRQITEIRAIAFEPELDVPRDNSISEQGTESQADLHMEFCAIDVARWLGGLFEVQKRVPRNGRPRHPTDPPPKPLKLLRVLSGISKGQVPTPKGHFAIQFGSQDPQFESVTWECYLKLNGFA